MKIRLNGQLCSGKNAMGVTRSGHHYPNKRFAEWRKDAAQQLVRQGCTPHTPIDHTVHLTVHYWAGDRRTRDITGMADALFHLFVYADILKDDGLIRDLTWRWMGIDREEPRVYMEIEPA